MKQKAAASTITFNIAGYIYICIISIMCLLPFLLIISGSLSSNEAVIKYGYSIIPREFSLNAYKTVFLIPDRILRSYSVTIATTAISTAAGLFFVTMGGYVLNRKDLKYRNHISFFIYFTTLFSGGLIPWYILMTKYLHLKNTYMALIIPTMMTPFLILLMRNFMKSIPDSIVESSKIDGAGDFGIFTTMILPLSKPALATIGLFIALASWNDWFLSSIFITEREKFKLQFLLYSIMSNAQFLTSGAASNVDTSKIQIPTETVKLATAVIATGPVVLFYPFVQKYFVMGITIGAVKG